MAGRVRVADGEQALPLLGKQAKDTRARGGPPTAADDPQHASLKGASQALDMNCTMSDDSKGRELQ